MTVSLPEEMISLLGDAMNPETGVRAILASRFYSTGRLSAGKAAELAGMKRWQFESWLHDHGIEMPWTEDDLKQEIETVQKLSGH